MIYIYVLESGYLSPHLGGFFVFISEQQEKYLVLQLPAYEDRYILLSRTVTQKITLFPL